jgi:phosphatidylserine/phosphatidylglycerophosphate/cardiolipin synthase-like enzyme
LIKAKERKIAVRVGVDQKPLHDPKTPKPAQTLVVKRLRDAGIDVTEVDSTGINHQKMIAIDWSEPNLARAVFSSGNFTHSCLDPRGDLQKVPATFLHSASQSIPNANHVITMKSWLAANLINHEITKVTTKDLHLRGRSFPTSGAYQITGPGVDPQTLEAYPENSFIIAFTPGGGNRLVNKNILAHLITKSEGPVRMTQFAYSSKEVATALLHRAERDVQANGKFDFKSVGDTPFAMQGWSQFLKMSGYKRVSEGKGKSKVTRFIEDSENPWKKSFTTEQLNEIRKNVRIAPRVYGNSHVKIEGTDFEVSAKIHHKIMSMGNFAVIGTSFNFSESAEGNNEQVLVFNDPKMAAVVRGITEQLASESPRSVAEEAKARNERRGNRGKLLAFKKSEEIAGAKSAVALDQNGAVDDDAREDEELSPLKATP